MDVDWIIKNPIHDHPYPSASFLLIIVAEGLLGMVRMATKKDLLQGINVGDREVLMNTL